MTKRVRIRSRISRLRGGRGQHLGYGVGYAGFLPTRQVEVESGALSKLALNGQIASVKTCDFPANREPEAKAATKPEANGATVGQTAAALTGALDRLASHR